jgi:prepilin-type N-terminal cleavage/methylation domain-containing protein
MNCSSNKARPSGHGFTLTEIMIALSIFSLVLATAVPVFIMCQRSWALTSVQLETSQKASAAMDRLVYGVGLQYGLRSAIATTVVFTAGTDWSVAYRDVAGNSNSFAYHSASNQLTYDGPDTVGSVVVGRSITAATVSNSARGMGIHVTAAVINGRFAATNTMTTYVSYRNR